MRCAANGAGAGWRRQRNRRLSDRIKSTVCRTRIFKKKKKHILYNTYTHTQMYVCVCEKYYLLKFVEYHISIICTFISGGLPSTRTSPPTERSLCHIRTIRGCALCILYYYRYTTARISIRKIHLFLDDIQLTLSKYRMYDSFRVQDISKVKHIYLAFFLFAFFDFSSIHISGHSLSVSMHVSLFVLDMAS